MERMFQHRAFLKGFVLMLLFYIQRSTLFRTSSSFSFLMKLCLINFWIFFMFAAMNCTFETGFCDFRQVATDDFDWTWTNTSTPTVGTGPDRDHTTGAG